SHRRAENGEFFYASREEIDAAFEKGIAFLATFQPLLAPAALYKEQKPAETLAESTDDIRQAYRLLKAARHDQLLLQQRIDFLECRIQVAIGMNAGMEGIALWDWVDNWQL